MPSKRGSRVRALGAAVVAGMLASILTGVAPGAAARPLCGDPMPTESQPAEQLEQGEPWAGLESGDDASFEWIWEEILGRRIASHGEVELLWNANLYVGYTKHDLVLTTGSSRRNRFYLQKHAAYAFTRMRVAAEADGLRLRVGSAWRSWKRQERAWENFEKTGTNLNGTPVPNIAHPCDSKHPAALAVDMDVRPNARLHKWLIENAATYGFVNTRADEPWEWQFVGIES